MRFVLILIFIAVPLLEIALLIKAGDSFGFWPTFALVVFTAILGATVMLRLQGMSVLARAAETLRAGGMPIDSVADGVFLIMAGAFLLTPGLLTDAVGLAFLVPRVRLWLGNKLLNAIKVRTASADAAHAGGQRGSRDTMSTAGNPGRPVRPRPGKKNPKVIDAEFEDLDGPT